MFSFCDGLPPATVAPGQPSRHQHTSGLRTARKWLLLNATNSAPGAQGLTTRMDERVKGSLDPAKALSEAYQRLAHTVRIYMHSPASDRKRHIPHPSTTTLLKTARDQ